MDSTRYQLEPIIFDSISILKPNATERLCPQMEVMVLVMEMISSKCRDKDFIPAYCRLPLFISNTLIVVTMVRC